VATRLPPQKTQTPVTQKPNNSSAASLLGGNYERSIADDGGGSFFESEIAASQKAPYAQLDAQQDKMMAAYFAEIRSRIKRNWSPDSPTEEYNTVLNFSIQRNGQITGLRVAKTSGSEQVDRETLEAVQNSAPFPPLPENFPFANLDIEFNFNIYLF
jgi:protein TonB